ncbi:uncharacterized protein LOC119458301 isoform X2 [Dermacentor silvarum]|uniref:uncharacterized protein LOC119458301 isoform X2 n=1 Tax=Dermacentor silvarum TaxID=543639 RepID=UPI001897CD1C|nr:uncharacterized protein LOC119458301 isoform X2 [Dermacentor silvarum]
MATKHLFTVFLFTTSLSMLECRLTMVKSALSGVKSMTRLNKRHRLYPAHCNKGTIAKFLCTKEPIWLYNTTGLPNRNCEVDQTMNMNQTSIHLLRLLYESGTKKTINIEGTFDQKNVKRLFLHIPSTTKVVPKNLTEDIEYLSKKLRCAVMRITSAGNPAIYDLLVRNSSIARGPSRGCMRKFANLTSTSLRMYEPSCQAILLKNAEPEITIGRKPNQENTHLR